jgi:orotate phosphoribosyltransferase
VGGEKEVTPEEVARLLVQVGAVEVRADPDQWFVWASGKRAPIYCDNRLVLGFPEERRQIADALAAEITRSFSGVETVAGTATAGIPWAALVAERLALPMVYVRSAPKEHGRGRQIEGRLQAGAPVVLVEDLISLGGSSSGAIEALRKEGAPLLGVQAIFSYGLPEADRRFAELGVQARALSDFSTLIETLELSPEQARALHSWRER